MSEFQLLNLYTDTMTYALIIKVPPTSQCAQPSVRHGREHRGGPGLPRLPLRPGRAGGPCNGRGIAVHNAIGSWPHIL